MPRAIIGGLRFDRPTRESAMTDLTLGYIEKAGSGYRLIPANWNPAL
jgi:hypothetical protein